MRKEERIKISKIRNQKKEYKINPRMENEGPSEIRAEINEIKTKIQYEVLDESQNTLLSI